MMKRVPNDVGKNMAFLKMISNVIEIYPPPSRMGSCYTLFMQSKTDWSQWAESLRRLKLNDFVAWILEAGAPLTVFGAQAIYMMQPFIGGKETTLIARMLEEEEKTQAFARYLRGEGSA